MPKTLAARIKQLKQAKQNYGAGFARQTEALLASFRNPRFSDAESLIEFHDALLFLRAFPHSPRVARLADRCLGGIAPEVARLRASGTDMDQFDDEQFSGIAGTTAQDCFTYEVARWLEQRDPRNVAADWDEDEQSRRLGLALPRFLPLLEDDALVEADVPFLRWMNNAAGGPGREWKWLMKRLEDSPLPIAEKNELYDALAIQLHWDLGDSNATRTRARRAVKSLFCHDAPLIRRNQVSIKQELDSPPLSMRKLSRNEGAKILDMVRDAITVRYRELHGTTRSDPTQVFQCDVGRGVQVFLWGLPPERRLPLRAYHAGLTLKNGVPINYIEGISLFECMEVGFNTFYAYRDGETAWIYAKVIHLLHQLTGVTCISIYPYQLGHDNEEAINSGAFWFYRKLGFRPGRPELLKIAQQEELKISRNAKYRTSARTLRKLAAGHVFYEFGSGPQGDWDTFSTRNVGMAVQKKIAFKFGGDAGKMRRVSTTSLAKALQVNLETWGPLQRRAFENMAIVMALAPKIYRTFSPAERKLLVRAIRAKVGPNESTYLRLMQRLPRVKEVFLRSGSIPK